MQWYAQLPSTNVLAAAFAERGAREGAVVVAESQTAGRGRLGRTWCSPPGAGLYVSVLLRPPDAVVPLLTLTAGVALADGVGAATGLTPVLKWPNDLHAWPPAGGLPIGRKLGGILAEAGTAQGGDRHVVVGFGINVRDAVYPPEVAVRATSLEQELGRTVDRALVLAESLAALAARYDDLLAGRAEGVLMAWRAYARPLLGRPVAWVDGRRKRRGVAENVDADGALRIRTKTEIARVTSGEVEWQ